jgi:hypothetical protein
MEPTSNNQPNINLPPPQPESDHGLVVEPDKTPEKPGSAESGGGEKLANDITKQGQAPVLPTLPTIPDPSLTVPLSTTPTDDSGPAMADDVDLIEKEWVTKAKAIVEQTKNDPHRQNKEINKIKADYMRKRYNKDVKVVED